jgi:hypothetical protein
MQAFETVWDLIKASFDIDLDDFNLDDVVRVDSPFPKGTQIMEYMKTPKGIKEAGKMGARARRIDYPLEGMELPDFRPKDPYNMQSELRDIFGGSAVKGNKWTQFSSPSKMINRTFSLPTHTCGIGGYLRGKEGSVCEACYAHNRGHYRYNGVQQKLLRNLDRLTTSDPVQWASAFSGAIPNETRNFPVFRYHDSGDLLSAQHASMIADITAKNPDVMSWVPTREWKMIDELVRARGGDMPSNFVPRISLPMVNQTLDNDENERRGVEPLDQRIIDLIQDNEGVKHSEVITEPKYATRHSQMKSTVCPVTRSKKDSCQNRRCSACYMPNVDLTSYIKH